jgi:hypothetical protein
VLLKPDLQEAAHLTLHVWGEWFRLRLCCLCWLHLQARVKSSIE